MVRTIPLTHYVDFVAQARVIQQRLGSRTDAPAVRQALVDLTNLAVRALAETNDAFEGMAALLMALHPEVRRTPRASRTTCRRPRRWSARPGRHWRSMGD